MIMYVYHFQRYVNLIYWEKLYQENTQNKFYNLVLMG